MANLLRPKEIQCPVCGLLRLIDYRHLWLIKKGLISSRCFKCSRFKKGEINSGCFKSGHIPINPYKKGMIPWNKGMNGWKKKVVLSKEERYKRKREADINYKKNHKEELNEKQRIYGKNHLLERKLYLNSKYKNDINFRLGTNLRNRLRRLLKKEKSSKIAIKNLGCTIEELKNHLGSQFLPGMTWMNHGIFGWHIDHIIPLSYFDLTIEEHIKKACHYTNLQPLWSIDNIKKGGIKNVKIKSIN